VNNNASIAVLRLGGYCALITVVTTFVVHLISIPADTFEQRLLLSQNRTYLIRNLVVIIHCICVVISMATVASARKDSAKIELLTWGSVGFLIFGLLEINRMVLALVYANGLRSAYLNTIDGEQQDYIRFALEVQWPLMSEVIFILFILAFGVGCLLMGFGIYRRGVRMDSILGVLLIIWGLQSLITLGNDYFAWGLGSVISTLSVTFQPGVRLFIAFWLLQKQP
jgi:hypothetical protein